jgi:hypothetical protein
VQLSSRLGGCLVFLSVVLVNELRAEAPDVDARLRASTYQDSDHTSVTTLGATANVEVPGAMRVGASYLADIVSSASVDVVSAATGRFHETRHEAAGHAELLLSEVELGGSYRYSVENDWRSSSIGATSSFDMAQKNTQLTLGGTLVLNQVGRADDPIFSKQLRTYALNLGLTQNIDKKTLAQLLTTISYDEGFQSSPYRYVSTSDRAFTFLERDPTTRLRQAAALRLRRSIFSSSSVGVEYRLYFDDWGTVGHTGQLRLSSDLSEVTSVALRQRLHYQDRANFYQASYDRPFRYMTVDRELSTFWDSFSGAQLLVEWQGVGPFTKIGADLSADFFYFRYLDFAPLPHRVGFVAAVGLLGAL